MQRLFVSYWSFDYIIAVILLALVLGCGQRFSGRATTQPTVLARRRGVAAVRLALIVLAIIQMTLYVFAPSFADYGEPTIPLLAGNFMIGQPVYSNWLGGESIVGSNYGPYIFLLQAAAMALAPTVVASKLVGAVAAVVALCVLLRAIRPHMLSEQSPYLLIALAIALLAFQLHYWFWNRPDPVLIFMVALAALVFDRCSVKATLAGLGLMAGIAVNLKLFALLYFVPFAVGRLPDGQWRPRFAGILCGGALFVVALTMPFIIGSFSATRYLANLMMMPHQGFDRFAVLQSVAYGILIFTAPLLAFDVSKASVSERVTLLASGVCALLVALMSGKPGGGPTYMMPFVPLAIYLTARFTKRLTTAHRQTVLLLHGMTLSVVALCAFPIWAYSYLQIGRLWWDYRGEFEKAAELRDLFVRFPEAQMGHNSGRTAMQDEFLRVTKAFLGQPVRFDYVNYADQRAAGVPSSILYPLFDNCGIPTWILSRSGEQFAGTTYFGMPVFDDGVRERFSANYRMVYQMPNYEVWSCKPRSP